MIAKDRALLCNERGESFAFYAYNGIQWNAIDDFRREDVATCVDEIGDRIFHLLKKCCDATFAINRYATEGAGIIDFNQMERDIGFVLLMKWACASRRMFR